MKRNRLGLLFILICVLTAAGCGNAQNISSTQKETGQTLETSGGLLYSGETIYEATEPGTYDSEGTAIITAISQIKKTITFYDYDLEKSYTLNYDGVTRFADKYDVARSVSQLKYGTIVDVKFLKRDKLLVALNESSGVFSIPEVTDFTINSGTKVFQYKSDAYKITSGTVLISEDGNLSIDELNPVDEVTITGEGNTIYAIYVDESHGYLSIKSDDYFTGGFIEIGDKQIEKISDQMVVTLREGSYDLKITSKGTNALKNVTIKAGQETDLDLSTIEREEAKTGKVLFSVYPDTTTLMVDNVTVNSDELLTFEYGLHQLIASAPGYDTVTRYFNVAEESAALSVVLEESSSSVSENTTEEEESLTEGHYVYITAPSDVEVYVDNIYIGMSPLAFDKEAGTHTITLRKTGYTTRSYTISLENTAEDVNYTFDTLAASTSSSTSVSDNE